jgi:TM2 domain-containing membrane protein YozV
MKKNILFFILIHFLQVSIAQTIDSVAVNNKQRSGAKPTNVFPAQVVDNQNVISKVDSVKIDTTKAKKKVGYFSKAAYSPRKAALFSLILPGAGQIYNKTGVWWKLPLCYAAYGSTIFLIQKNQRNYKKYYNIYANYINDTKYVNPDKISREVADKNRQISRKNLEYSWVALFGAHLFCVSDAFVTAHLNQFDIDDNLNLKVSTASESLGIKLKFTF